jgi:glutamate/aspartate transport system substrate-binding protein
MDICMKVVDAVKRQLNMPNLKVALNGHLGNADPADRGGTIDLECGSTTNNLDRQSRSGSPTPIRDRQPLRRKRRRTSRRLLI